jgi:serine/threonine protein kinase
MVGELHKIGHLVISRRAGGEPVELVRAPEEVVFLAFDGHMKRLVELHVLRSGGSLATVGKRAAFDRAREATAMRSSAFMRILEVGEDQGLVYYTTNLNDGELVKDYVARRGAFSQATALCLVLQLLEDLIQLQEHRWLVAHMRLDRVVVSTLEDAFLQLRVYDYGLSGSGSDETSGEGRLVCRACELIFLMLTGKEFDGDNPDRYPALSGLPVNLRITLRAALMDPLQTTASLETLRDHVREAYGAVVGRIQSLNVRKQLVVTPALQPRSQLQDLLLENAPLEATLGTKFMLEDSDQVRRYPFSIPCVHVKSEQPVTVHLLPPARIVDKAQYEAVPLQTWRFDSEKHPNILRSLSVWETPEWTFLSEEREPGFTLSRLMAERNVLNPAEVLVVMRQVRAGMEQALECGVQRLDLHPSNIVLKVGKAGPLLNREYERLMQKRLDAWPHFQVKLRAHLTMRNLCEPLLVDPPQEGEHPQLHLADRDYRHRAFVMLAAYLLTGVRFTGGTPRFPEALSEEVVTVVTEMLELTRRAGQTPGPAEFLEKFESAANGPAAPDLAARLRGREIRLEEMESAGAVSDFDEEWTAEGPSLEEEELTGPVARTIKVTQLSQRPRSRAAVVGPVWAAAAAVVLAMGSWWYFSNEAIMTPPAQAGGVVAFGTATGSEPGVTAEKKTLKGESENAEKVQELVAPPKPVAAKPMMVKKSDGGAAEGGGRAMPPVFASMTRAPSIRAAHRLADATSGEAPWKRPALDETAPRPPLPVMARVPKADAECDAPDSPCEFQAAPNAADVLTRPVLVLTRIAVEEKSLDAYVIAGAGMPSAGWAAKPRLLEDLAPPLLSPTAEVPPKPVAAPAVVVESTKEKQVKTESVVEEQEPPQETTVRRALLPTEEEIAELRRQEEAALKKAAELKSEPSAKRHLSRR